MGPINGRLTDGDGSSPGKSVEPPTAAVRERSASHALRSARAPRVPGPGPGESDGLCQLLGPGAFEHEPRPLLGLRSTLVHRLLLAAWADPSGPSMHRLSYSSRRTWHRDLGRAFSLPGEIQPAYLGTDPAGSPTCLAFDAAFDSSRTRTREAGRGAGRDALATKETRRGTAEGGRGGGRGVMSEARSDSTRNERIPRVGRRREHAPRSARRSLAPTSAVRLRVRV
jgi:hypothetical protein